MADLEEGGKINVDNVTVDVDSLDPNAGGAPNGTKNIAREALENEMHKVEVRLKGDVCVDDSRGVVWSAATGVQNEDLFVIWLLTNPEAEGLKDMVANWDQFVVLSTKGKKLGTARDYFLTS